MEYTKGEWKASRIVQDELWIMCNNLVIAQTYIADGNEEANAHLIAAAPDMYELLKEIRNADLEMSQAMEATIELALAKADGKS